jgi:DNA invertase Pin-like site-specific DNA recombinase
LNEKGVQFISKKESIDTNTPAGKFMLTIMGAMAELERENILERQAEVIAIAKAEGRFNGRPKVEIENFEELYSNLKKNKLSVSKICKTNGIARSTWYRKVK